MEPGPSQQRSRDAIALGSLFSALTPLNPGGLLPLAVKLLDLPAHRSRLSDCRGRSFRKIVGGDPFGVSGRGDQPEQFDLMSLGNFFEVNEFSVRLFTLIEGQSIQSLGRNFRALSRLSVPLQKAIVDFVGRLARFDHLHAGIPRIHQDYPDRLGTALESTVEHLQEVIDLAAAITLWIEEAKIENPEALQLWVDVDTSDHPGAGNHCMGVAAPLSSYHFNETGMSLVEHCVVKK